MARLGAELAGASEPRAVFREMTAPTLRNAARENGQTTPEAVNYDSFTRTTSLLTHRISCMASLWSEEG